MRHFCWLSLTANFSCKWYMTYHSVLMKNLFFSVNTELSHLTIAVITRVTITLWVVLLLLLFYRSCKLMLINSRLCCKPHSHWCEVFDLTHKTRYVCLLPMAGQTAGLIKTKLGIGTHVDPGSVLGKVKVIWCHLANANKTPYRGPQGPREFEREVR